MRSGRIWAGLLVVTVSAVAGSFLGWAPWLAAATTAVLLGLALAEILERAGALKKLGSGAFDAAMRGSRGSPSRPTDLERIERLVGQKVFSADDFDVEVRPLLRELIQDRAPARGRTTGAAAEAPLPSELAVLAGGSSTEERGVRRVETRDLQRIVALIEDLR